MCARVAVAMSGGVDSSTAAFLLKQEGHDLVGITMKLFDTSSVESEDAASVAQQLGFAHHTVDLSQTFRCQVMDQFVHCYERGETPNPCINCNYHLKFGALLDQALALEQEKIATGHYVRLDYDSGAQRWLLKKALHPEKDQSYVLYSLTQHQLSHSLFPLGSLSKEEIREIALTHNLVSARKKDSQDICFIPDGDYAAFIRRYTGRSYPQGSFLDEDGNLLGTHTGIVDYTIGQRRGLGVSSTHGRLYVKEVRPEENAVILSSNESLFTRTFTAAKVNWIPFDRLDSPLHLLAKVRYRMVEQPCVAEPLGEDRIRVTFEQPQRAITPGQAVVFYDGDCVVGGATILKGD